MQAKVMIATIGMMMGITLRAAPAFYNLSR